MNADPRLQQLTEENQLLAARLAEAEEVLRALRNGQADALVGAEGDAVYGVQLIALAVDQADTYEEALGLLLRKLCQSTDWSYA